MEEKTQGFTVTSSPFAHDDSSTAKLMTHYMVALLPALFMSALLFKGSTMILTGICIISSMLWESITCLMLKKKNSAGDITAAVTGLLFAMTLPPGFSVIKALAGTLIAVGILKTAFDHIDFSPLNCALAARLLIYLLFKGDFVYIAPFTNPSMQAIAEITEPTPLQGGWDGQYSSLFLGNVSGGIGEVSALAALLGLIYLLSMRVISIYGAASFAGSVFLFSLATGNDGLFNLLAGGVMLAAVFFATDSRTTPLTPVGKIIFGVTAGILTCVIRFYTPFSQDWVTAILITDLLTPVIDRFFEKRSQFAKE